MLIYIDSNYRCHLENHGNYRCIETSVFNGMCKAYIEGYRYIPTGESWMRSDGVIFTGEMIAPAEDYSRLEKAQSQYELDEDARWGGLNIPQEADFTATRNYSVKSFLAVRDLLYEVVYPIPMWSSIVVGQNVIETTMEHYLETIKEE